MFKDDLVGNAVAEWKLFGKDEGSSDHKVKVNKVVKGKTVEEFVNKELVGDYAKRIGDYWLSISEKDYNNLVAKFAKKKGKLDGTVKLAWSAAFISYCMQTAGAGNEFPYAPGHVTWIVKSIKNKKAKKLNASLVGYKPGEVEVVVGDLVANSRTDGIDYDNATTSGWYESHSDIVVEVDTAKKRFYTIGGNVGQSVSRKTFALDKDGKIASGSGLLVHIQNNITGTTTITAAMAAKTVNVG